MKEAPGSLCWRKAGEDNLIFLRMQNWQDVGWALYPADKQIAIPPPFHELTHQLGYGVAHLPTGDMA